MVDFEGLIWDECRNIMAVYDTSNRSARYFSEHKTMNIDCTVDWMLIFQPSPFSNTIHILILTQNNNQVHDVIGIPEKVF